MRIQLWSYNYDPEPQGIGPLSTVMAEELSRRGHDVLVVAAHPHYPNPVWGVRAKPYRECRRGIQVLRLPLWIGRENGRQRVRQELSFAVAQSAAAALLPPCDVIVAVSPNLPALAPCMVLTRLRRIPWVLWLQDIVTEGAATTGLLGPGGLLHAARTLELQAYESAARIVVISDSFRRQLATQGVSPEKIVRIYNPATRPFHAGAERREVLTPPRLLAMGNIGHSQGLDRIVDAFEQSEELAELGARLVIAGHGVEAAAVRARIRGPRVEMRGVLGQVELDRELRSSSLAIVSQRADVAEFNLPSKLMNYMGFGIPVIASVRPDSETARIVSDSGGGWVTDARWPEQFAAAASRSLRDPEELRRTGAAARRFAEGNFDPRTAAEQFETVLRDVLSRAQGSTANDRRSSRESPAESPRPRTAA